VADFEHARRVVSKEAITGIRRSLAVTGIIFVETEGGEPSVLLSETK
jgi:hypothetical protein